MFKKRYIIGCIILIIVVLMSVALCALTSFIHSRKNNLSETQLSSEEIEMFKKCFGIEKPSYLSVLQCVSNQDKTTTYFAVKAVISTPNINTLINEIRNSNSTIYGYKHNRTPVADDFAQALSWWNIESGRHILSYNIQLDDHNQGSAAVTIVRDNGYNYVYMWYTNPALIAK